MGMGNRAPMHNVTFYDKESRITKYDALNIQSEMPDYLNFETFFIVFKNTEEPEKMRAANRYVLTYLTNNNISLDINA